MPATFRNLYLRTIAVVMVWERDVYICKEIIIIVAEMVFYTSVRYENPAVLVGPALDGDRPFYCAADRKVQVQGGFPMGYRLASSRVGCEKSYPAGPLDLRPLH